MHRFIYFFPGCHTADQATAAMRSQGLDGVVEAEHRPGGVWERGPAGDVPGYALTNTSPEASGKVDLKYAPETQTWTECGDGEGRFWIGHATGSAPGPSDLARPTQVRGAKVKLADGGWWQVPMALAWPVGQLPLPEGVRATALPETFRVVAGGGVERAVVRQYEDLYEFASGVYDAVLTGADGSTAPDGSTGLSFSRDETELLPWAARALSVNYFAGKWELGAVLRAFDTTSITSVLQALLNWPAFEMFGAMLAGKKNPPPDFYTRFGGFEGSFLDTFRVSAS